MFAVPFVWILPRERHDDGLNVVVSSIERIRAQAVDPTVKNYHWLDLVRGLFEAYEQGGETAVLVDARGNVLEGPGFNLFVIRDGVVATPGAGVLEGVTRGHRDRAAAAARRVEIELRDVHARRAARRRRGVRDLDGGRRDADRERRRPRGSATAPISRRLLDDYWAAHADPAWTTPVRRDLAETAPA